MGRLSSLPNKFVAFWYMYINDVFESKHMVFDTNMTTSKSLKESGPFVETSCVFQCIKNIINAEMWA